jgi:hypothetical protein
MPGDLCVALRMIERTRLDSPPEPLNATDFMNAVIALTPEKPLIQGRVDVAVFLDINEQGQVTRIEAQHDNPGISRAAEEAAAVLRFDPARFAGRPIAYSDYCITIGFWPAPD